MFRNFCVVFLAALTTFILLLTFYIARSDLSLRLILFSAGDVLYIKNILPVVAAAIPPFAGLSGLIYFAGRMLFKQQSVTETKADDNVQLGAFAV